ncbi:adenylyltransferase/cytidyltransferase family protein [Candidatus Roizmanbacteria bacterium]|nr:MAG: adenylyltransferase/cytidyltransferase family protein [Candidatus Roizmanbacteria bacterium]
MENKVVAELDFAANLSYNFKSISKVVVLVNGVFDILHPGHIYFLEQARSHGDVVFAGVQSDDAIKQFANPKGPVNSLEHRMKVLASVSLVDYVVSYAEKNASNLIGEIKPTIYVLAGDYKKGQLPEEAVIKQIEGTIQTVKYDPRYSTREVIDKAVALYSQPQQESSSE